MREEVYKVGYWSFTKENQIFNGNKIESGASAEIVDVSKDGVFTVRIFGSKEHLVTMSEQDVTNMLLPREYQVIVVEAKLMNYYNELLDAGVIDLHAKGISKYSTVDKWTAEFSNGIEVDIKICSSTDQLFVQAVLFDNGSDVSVIEVEYELDGEYYFEYKDVLYVIKVCDEEEKDDNKN